MLAAAINSEFFFSCDYIRPRFQPGLFCAQRHESVIGNVNFTKKNRSAVLYLPPVFAGAGLRLMFNKLTQTHVSIDYPLRKGNLHGIFLNLGEFLGGGITVTCYFKHINNCVSNLVSSFVQCPYISMYGSPVTIPCLASSFIILCPACLITWYGPTCL